MGVYLGCVGYIELKRTSLDEAVVGTVAQSDVNAVKDRFSFSYPSGLFITGDQVELRSTDGGLLSFIAASGWPTHQQYRDGVWYVHVDEVGAIRLYQHFDQAVAGEVSGRVDLVDAGRSVPISMKVRNNGERILAQVKGFELNTERDAVDVTALSDEFRSNYSGLISGNGNVTCFFDYERRGCDPMMRDIAGSGFAEMPIYVNQVLLRTRIGSEFWAKFVLIGTGPKPGGRSEDNDDMVWYEFDARVTNVGMAFEPTQPIEARIDFVTTGEIKLRTKYVSNYLTQENYDRLRTEENLGDGFLEVEQQS